MSQAILRCLNPRGPALQMAVVAFLLCGAEHAAAQPIAADLEKGVEVAPGVTVAAPFPWRIADRSRNALELALPSKSRKHKLDARMSIVVELRRSHAEAVQRLGEVAAEVRDGSDLRLIAGCAAVERRVLAPLPVPGVASEREDPRAPRPKLPFQKQVEETGNSLRVTTAIAAGENLVRFETVLSTQADPRVADEAQAIGHHVQVAAPTDPALAARDIEQVKSYLAQRRRVVAPAGAAPPGGPTAAAAAAAGQPAEAPQPGAVSVQPSYGELEIAASADGQTVVVAANPGFSVSTNGGQTFNFSGGTPCTLASCDGDPSLAVGKSGAFYYSWIGGQTTAGFDTDALSVSPDGVQPFNFRSSVVVCGATCNVPDQEHIAADRANASASGQDQVYLVWRNFANLGQTPRIVCSTDGGATWSAQVTIGTGDFPRVAVGPDGSVYTVFVDPNHANVLLNKYSSCASGLAQQPGFPVTVVQPAGAPVTVAPFGDVPCPQPGLDRCNFGNVLSSPTVAADDLDPNHVYVAFATPNGAGNVDVQVWDSTDGGNTWPRSVNANSAVTAQRFMPWMTTYGGVAHVGWYDRRNAAAAAQTAGNDRTRYFGGSARVQAGNLIADPEVDVSQVDDGQCSTWPCATSQTSDSESCVQPQLAGLCQSGPAAMPGDSNTPCDFDETPCPAGESCRTGTTAALTGGCPKYGDYNGLAAIGGRVFRVWSSATPPPGMAAPGPGINLYEDTRLAPADLFVRDWTDSDAVHDTGVEPSIRDDFFDTSDVWNQINLIAYAPVGGWVQGDNAILGGTNFAFARVSRRAAAAPNAPDVSATVRFLWADYGAGANFSDLGTETVTLAATDTVKVSPAHSWAVPAMASSHLCLAVQLEDIPGDPFQIPSLIGTSPVGNSPLIRNDDNKAQRNLSAALGSGVAGMEAYAVVHNPELATATLTLEYTLPEETQRLMAGGRVGVVGQDQQELRPRGTLAFENMQPGENRWVKVTFGSFKGAAGQLLPVRFIQRLKDRAVSGFTIAARPTPLARVLAENLRLAVAVLGRDAALTDSHLARREAAAAAALLPPGNRPPEIAPQSYFDYLRQHLSALRSLVRAQLEGTPPTCWLLRLLRWLCPSPRGKDTLGLEEAVDTIDKALARSDTAALAVAHSVLLERFDTHLTVGARARGNAADILQNVRWQKALFDQNPQLERADEIRVLSERFVTAYGNHTIGPADYPRLLEQLADDLHLVARQLADSELGQLAKALRERLGASPESLQKAHRSYLLRLQQLDPGRS